MTRIAIVLPLFALMLGGCAAFNRMELHRQNNTTIGQELIDLDKARAAGLLSEVEYAKAKQQLLEWAKGWQEDVTFKSSN